MAARLENLRLPLGADGREICLRFSSKGDCNRSCTRSHAPLRGRTRYLVIRFIMWDREEIKKINKRKFDGIGDQGYHRGHWDRGGYHGHRNSETQNGARFGGGRGGGRDGNNGGGSGARGGHGSKTNPPHRKLGTADRPVAKGVGQRRQNNGWGDGEISVRSAIGAHSRRGNIREVRHWCPQDISEDCHRGAYSEVSHRRSHDISESCHCVAHSEACHHGAQRILVCPAIAALTVRPDIAALTMFINDKHFVN